MDIGVDAHAWGREIEFRVKENMSNQVTVQFRSKNYPHITVYLDTNQLIKLAIEIDDFLRERSLAKALPDPPEIEENEIWL